YDDEEPAHVIGPDQHSAAENCWDADADTVGIFGHRDTPRPSFGRADGSREGECEGNPKSRFHGVPPCAEKVRPDLEKSIGIFRHATLTDRAILRSVIRCSTHGSSPAT